VGLVRPGGRVVLTGLPHDAARIEFFWVVRREIDIRGSMIYRDEFGDAVALLAGGDVRVAPLLTHRFPLAAIDAALQAHRDPASIKVAVFPGNRSA
jgi:threonine dehydrogenase-like Zn-dependent dehydrogenase